ncbi:hypothetical protein ACVBGC_30380 [Burkholderia stagnalis]
MTVSLDGVSGTDGRYGMLHGGDPESRTGIMTRGRRRVTREHGRIGDWNQFH